MGFRPLLKDGKETARTDTPDVARNAERQGIGWTKDGYIIYWCDKTKMLMPDFMRKMLELGAVDAGAFDGGGSVQGICPREKLHPRVSCLCICLCGQPKKNMSLKGANRK
jgi:exopolysaccharide biosynthesis protein